MHHIPYRYFYIAHAQFSYEYACKSAYSIPERVCKSCDTSELIIC